jgi:SAM-dependent methyltransferase
MVTVPPPLKFTPSDHKAGVQQTYTRHVDAFEHWTPTAPFQETFRHVVLNEIRQRLDAAPSLRILEVGSGHGTWAEAIFKEFPDKGGCIQYTGIDFTAARVDAARRRLQDHPSASFLCADCELFTPPQPFDLILVVEVISHVPFARYPDWFARWRGWLAPGGSVVIIDKDRYSRHNLRLKWDSFKRRLLPSIMVGRRYYFSDDFADLVETLDYPSFARMSRIARRTGLTPRPIFEHGMFRALTADRAP